MITTDTRRAIQNFIERHSLAMETEFVAYSKSRHAGSAGNPDSDYNGPSLNWVVRITKGGRAVIDNTDYTAGCAHAPSYRGAVSEVVAWECELGTAWIDSAWSRGAPIEPDMVDVLTSLAMDASVIDYPTFEGWAEDFGIDTDSRSGERAYRACISTALKLRSALGDAALSELRELANEY